jgi:hypothetical protein
MALRFRSDQLPDGHAEKQELMREMADVERSIDRSMGPSLKIFQQKYRVCEGRETRDRRLSVSTLQRCSDFVSPCATQAVLFVGAERADEFSDATRLVCQGHEVTVINPRETAAASAFRRAGGAFVRARIEQLPPACCQFDVICENYPYPSGRHYVPPRAFAVARLVRLAPGGRWVLFTEAARYASLLKAVGDYDEAVQGRFRVGLSSLSPSEAPPSAYPSASTRFRLIFERRR